MIDYGPYQLNPKEGLMKELALQFQRLHMTEFEVNYYFSHYELETLKEMFLD